MMEIHDLTTEHPHWIEQAAALLVAGFQENWSNAWPDMDSAREEVQEALAPGKICRVAVEADRVLGWVGGISGYNGNAWELHPLVVDPARQHEGIGRALVADLETQVRARGASTLHLGTDDEAYMTSLGNVDLYPDIWEHVRRIQNRKGHPFSFYQKLGFVIVGILPDANGPGKPDIYMAKRVSAPVIVSLSEVVAAMDTAVPGAAVYLHRKTGKLITLTAGDLARAQERLDPDKLSRWEQEILEQAQAVLYTGDYLPLPTQAELNEPGLMQQFCETLPDDERRADLLTMVQTPPPYRRFRDGVHVHGLAESWHSFRAASLEAAAVDWLDDHTIMYRLG